MLSVWDLDWWYLVIRCFAFQGHFVLSTVWDGCYKVSLCLIPILMYRCLQCLQAWQISTKVPFEADFRFLNFWPWQKYLGGRQQSCPTTSLPVASSASRLQWQLPWPWCTFILTCRKYSGTVRMSRAGEKGLIGMKRGWPTLHSPWLSTDLEGTSSVASTELQIQWIWLCSRIWT